MAGRLPLAGLEATFFQINKFLTDIKRYNKGIISAKTTTKAGAQSMTDSAQKMAKAWDPFAHTFEDVKSDAEKLGGSLEDLGNKTARLTVPAGEAAGAVRGMATDLEMAGYQVEVVEQKVEDATGVFEGFRKSMLAMGGLRGGMMFRFMKGMGGMAATTAVVGYVAIRAAKAIGKATEKLVEALEGMERTDVATSSLEKLGQQAGVTADAIVAGAVIASRYTLKSAEVTVRANQLILTSHQQVVSAIPRLAEAAFVTARALGMETKDVLDDWIEAITEGDAATLEAEYGFKDIEKAVEDYARSMGVAEEDIKGFAREHIVLQAVLGQTEDYTSRLGESSIKSAGIWRKFWADFKDTLAENLYLQRRISDLYAEIEEKGIEVSKERAGVIQGERGQVLDLIEVYEALLEVLGRAAPSAFELEKWRKYGESGRLAIEEQMLAEKNAEGFRARAAEREEERVLEVLDARQGYRDQLEADLISLTGYGLSSEKILGLIEQKAEGLDALMLQLGDDILTPKGKIALIEFFEGVSSIGEAAEEVTAKQQEINDAVSSFVVEALEMGMPYQEALRYGEEMRTQLEGLGDLSTEEAQAAANAIVGIFTNMLDRMAQKTDSFIKGLVERSAAEFGKWETQTARKAITIAPYVTFEQYQQYAEGYNKAMEEWYRKYQPNLWGDKAQFDLAIIKNRWDSIASSITRAGKGIGTSVSSMKKLADETLLASKYLGKWATAFKAGRGGTGVLAAYARHEEPLTAALIDKLWGEQFAKDYGRPPTEEDWKAHWYEYWYPKELYHAPGAPIGAAGGPLAEEARKLLSEQGLKGLGDIYQDEYLQRKGLLGEMDKETLAREDQVEALGDLTAAFRSATEVFTPPTGDEEDSTEGAVGAIVKTIAKELGAGWTGIPEFQHGGLTSGAGLAFLHAGELVIPLNRLIDTVSMYAAGGNGGGLSIQNLSIPVTVGSGASPTVARDVQTAVIHAIKNRGGTEMRRAARRLGR